MSDVSTLLVRSGSLACCMRPTLVCPSLDLRLVSIRIVNDVNLIDLEEVFDPPLTSLLFVSPSFSSTPIVTSISDLTLLASPLPLAQCTGLEICEITRYYIGCFI